MTFVEVWDYYSACLFWKFSEQQGYSYWKICNYFKYVMFEEKRIFLVFLDMQNLLYGKRFVL